MQCWQCAKQSSYTIYVWNVCLEDVDMLKSPKVYTQSLNSRCGAVVSAEHMRHVAPLELNRGAHPLYSGACTMRLFFVVDSGGFDCSIVPESKSEKRSQLEETRIRKRGVGSWRRLRGLWGLFYIYGYSRITCVTSASALIQSDTNSHLCSRCNRAETSVLGPFLLSDFGVPQGLEVFKRF